MADNGSDDSSGSSNSRWKKSKAAGGLRAAGQSLSDSGSDMMDRASSDRITPVAFRKGGKVRKAKRKTKRPKSRE
jgi:hypothetical protein